ncbi:hypothetical protein SKAU_G00186790 [Synaphobranchus kaupii]|uniref:Uncharacterized protein n=1 Tax=Synaphobranchus kaupii TaxID=118154 RepID=A0A9Q1IX19_SYNKA|nr:hypothetical protein SKAU_G00186790 [Synaphobranchus kaupii]
MSSLIFGQDTGIADIPEEDLKYCGAGICTQNISGGDATRPEQKLVYTLVGCYIGVGILAMVSGGCVSG